MLTLTLPRVVAAFIESKPLPARTTQPPPVDSSRARLMDQIITINPSATAAFLDRFRTPDLEQYLGHLEVGSSPRGGNARWVRPEGKPGIVVHEARA